MLYPLRRDVFMLWLLMSSFCANCEVAGRNCTSFENVLKEKSRDCVGDADGGLGGEGHKGNATYNNNPSEPEEEPQKWVLQLTEKTGLSIQKTNDDLTLKVTKLSTNAEARKKRITYMDIVPYLIIPGFISAGVLPWLIPGMKIAVMGVAMINQMAFTSSLFSLIRGYIFDTSQEDHIVYVNHGYQHQKHVHKHR